MVCEEVEGLEEQGCGCGDEWIEWRWSSVWEEVRKEHLCSISQLSTSLKDQSSKKKHVPKEHNFLSNAHFTTRIHFTTRTHSTSPIEYAILLVTHGYQLGAPIFYVSITKEYREERFVKDVDTSKWDPHWTSINKDFEAKLASNLHLRSLCGHMFFIYDGNHRFKAWTGYIDRLH
jgi:hypothetical protein